MENERLLNIIPIVRDAISDIEYLESIDINHELRSITDNEAEVKAQNLTMDRKRCISNIDKAISSLDEVLEYIRRTGKTEIADEYRDSFLDVALIMAKKRHPYNRDIDKLIRRVNDIICLCGNDAKKETGLQVPASTMATTFKNKIIAENKQEVLNKLHSLIDGKRGKNVALVIIASIELGLIQKPTYREVQREFGEIGAESGYHSYLNKDKFSSNEYEGMKKRLSK